MTDMIPVTSSYLAAVAYDPATRTLTVEFAKGKRPYNYFGVPPDEFADLMGAESLGKYFISHIRGSYQNAPVQTEDNNE